MFLNLLTERQKQSFLALATKVVMADGNVVPEESVTLDVRVAEMGGHIKAACRRSRSPRSCRRWWS